MMTEADIKRLKDFSLAHLNDDQIRRLTNAENQCKIAETNWSKKYWFDVFQKLCEKYGAMSYFRKVIH